MLRYGVSRTDKDYELFEQFMRVPMGDAKTRRALLTDESNMDVAREGFWRDETTLTILTE